MSELPAKIGRPSTYSQEIAAEILNRMSCGEYMTHILESDPKFPTHVTLYNWMDKHPEFLTAYARARDLQARRFVEQCLEISDEARHEDNAAKVQAARLRVDTRKWVAARLAPREWGEKQQIEHSGAVGSYFLETIEKEAPAGSGDPNEGPSDD
jgi:hypothetical protein